MSSAFHLSLSSSSVNPWLPSPQNMKRPWRWWWKSSLKRLTSLNPDLLHTQWKNLPWSSFASSPLSLSSGQRKRKFYHFRNFVRVPICGNLVLVYFKLTWAVEHTLAKFHIDTKFTFWKISIITKFTILRSHFSQNSQSENIIFNKIHIFKRFPFSTQLRIFLGYLLA